MLENDVDVTDRKAHLYYEAVHVSVYSKQNSKEIKRKVDRI